MKNDNETNDEFTNYSKNQLEKAGKAIVKYSDKTEEYKKSIRIVDGFRKAHAYSLEEINQIIEQEFKDEHDYMIVH